MVSQNQNDYNPLEYWASRGKNYINWFYEKERPRQKIERQERILMQYLILHPDICNSGRILEVGAGFGRITKLVLEKFHQRIEEYVLLDLSKDQLYNARVYLTENLEPSVLKSVNVKFIQCDFMDFVSNDDDDDNNKFGLVLASEVLMHVLPEDIKQVMDKMVSLCKPGGNILNIDWYEDDPTLMPKVISPINCVHEYEKIYRENKDVESVRRIPIRDNDKKDVPEQSLFHVIKRK